MIDTPTHTADELRDAAAELRQFPKWKSASEKLEAGADAMDRVKVLEELLKECADVLSEYVEAHYAKTKDYPSELRRYQRDIEPVIKARAIAKLGGK